MQWGRYRTSPEVIRLVGSSPFVHAGFEIKSYLCDKCLALKCSLLGLRLAARLEGKTELSHRLLELKNNWSRLFPSVL